MDCQLIILVVGGGCRSLYCCFVESLLCNT